MTSDFGLMVILQYQEPAYEYVFSSIPWVLWDSEFHAAKLQNEQ